MQQKLTSGAMRFLGLASVLVLGLVPVRLAMAQPSYVVEDLGALPGDSSSVGWGINENGDVVGWSNGPAGTRAFVYTDANGMVALPAAGQAPNHSPRHQR
jgi:probable HAF family extracellular repeat protein